jgi:hypothetical protein
MVPTLGRRLYISEWASGQPEWTISGTTTDCDKIEVCG